MPLAALLQDVVNFRAGLTSELRALHGGDLATVEARVRREVERNNAHIEGGCAARVMRIVVAQRAQGADHSAAYALARSLIQHEIRPSPGWRTLCIEAGLTHDPIGGENDR